MVLNTFSLLSALAFTLAVSCSSDPAPIHTAPDTVTSKTSFVFSSDPYFIETRDTISSTGPTNITRDVIQDKIRGDVWIAAFDGLWHYRDGVFTNITLKEGLAHCRVFSLLEDRKGNIWIGTMGAGAYCYDGKTYTQYTIVNGLTDNFIECMMADPQGNIWFGTNAGVSMYDGKTFTNAGPTDGITGVVHAICMDSSGTVWIGTDDGVFNMIQDGYAAFPMNPANNAPFTNVRAIACDRKGIVWIGGADGLWKYDHSAAGRKEATLVMKNFTSHIRDDRSGNLLLSVGSAGVSQSGMMLLNMKPDRNDTLAIQGDHNDNQIFGAFTMGTEEILYGTMQGIKTAR